MVSMYRSLLLAACLALVPVLPAFSQSGANVLLVANEASADSGAIAAHYARVRGVPPDQVLRVTVSAADEIDRGAFNANVEAPIAAWLRQHAAQDRILYIVLAKGIPLRVAGTPGRDGTMASVDSELTLLYRRLVGRQHALDGRLANPYFLGTRPVAEAKTFSRAASDLYLVTRLDGYSVRDVTGLIDRGAAPVREGQILLDQKAGVLDGAGNEWLTTAADRLAKIGFASRVVLEATSAVLRGRRNVLGYYSWGSNDWANTLRRLELSFVPGAIAGMYVSTDGRTFTEPPAGWTIGRWTDRTTFFAGSPQSLAGDLIHEGVTGVAAHVAEPFLDATVRPDILFPAYVSGFNLAESFYLAIALSQLADRGGGRPAVRAVPAAPAAAGRHRRRDRPGHRAARPVCRPASAGARAGNHAGSREGRPALRGEGGERRQGGRGECARGGNHRSIRNWWRRTCCWRANTRHGRTTTRRPNDTGPSWR